MEWIFRSGKENTADRCRRIGRGFRRGQSGKDIQTAKPIALKTQIELQPLELGSLHTGSVAHGLAVPAPRRRTRLAGAQTPGVRTIQYSVETL
jgi:hypothetical protein